MTATPLGDHALVDEFDIPHANPIGTDEWGWRRILIYIGYVMVLFRYRIILVSLLMLSIAAYAFREGVEAGLLRRITRLLDIPRYRHREAIEALGSVAVLFIIVTAISLLRISAVRLYAGRMSRRRLFLFVISVGAISGVSYHFAYQKGFGVAPRLQGFSEADAELLGRGPETSGRALIRIGDVRWE